MKRFEVGPRIPEPLAPLERLAGNLWMHWQADATALFQRMDPVLWRKVHHNPLLLLARIDPARLEALAADRGFLAEVERVVARFDGYLENPPRFSFGLEAPLEGRIAYFSPEFGLAEFIPVYSGGLGVLSGDHLKSASDLGVPLVGVGLLYREGYFRQYLNADGYQQEAYPRVELFHLPLEPVLGPDGKPVRVEVPLAERKVAVTAHRLRVGRVPLYLLDSHLEENDEDLRGITAKLYGGDREMRIRQEMVLGVGGVRLLEAIGEAPDVLHMNEGHSAFAALERMRAKVERGIDLEAAKAWVRATTVFTTHTPVPAGNEIFDAALAARYLKPLADGMGLPVEEVLGWGRFRPMDPAEPLGMTVLSLRIAAFANGVSRLHEKTSRTLWKSIFPDLPMEDIPIGHVTNGVHLPTWISREHAALYDRYLGPGWQEEPDNAKAWERVDEIPETELWRTHERRRERLIAFARRRLAESLAARGAAQRDVMAARGALDPGALTICFARRFATYKRATLLFRDPSRLARILNDPERPAQIIFSGKAHPQDEEGKDFIRKIVHLSQRSEFAGRVVFLEDYDINVARYLIQGADVWLNNPRRPLEASGTSGMKAAANGGLNLSTRDGWWDEAYRGDNGWAVGAGEEYEDAEAQDEIEARTLYEMLEKEIVPLFYDRGPDGLPHGWIERMRSSLRTIVPFFNAHRMLEEYVARYYAPAATFGMRLAADDLARAKALAAWQKKTLGAFAKKAVRILRFDAPDGERFSVGDEVEVAAEVELGPLAPEDVAVEVVYGVLDAGDAFAERWVARLKHAGGKGFAGRIPVRKPGRYGARARVRPDHEDLAVPLELGVVVWSP